MMRTRLNGMLTLLLALVVQITFAQERTVTGTVSDASGVLPNVSILIKGTKSGTETDFDGNYTIKTKTGDVLVFSFVGMKSVERTVGSSNVINVTLVEDSNILDEVVILGYGTKTKNELTGSVVTVKSEQIRDVPVLSVDQALQGRVAGLQISSTSGTPGAIQDIRIRGAGSLSASNSPLYVIDGVPVVSGDFSGSGSSSSLSALVSINSKDVESMTVLKDASATAAYGARGSNGVIVITTKRGKQGKARFSFTSTFGFQNEARNERRSLTAHERATLLDEAAYNAYGAAYNFTKADARAFVKQYNLGSINSWDETSEYNWGDLVGNKDATIKDYNISVSGGSEKTSYYASLGYNETEMLVIGEPFKRISGSFSMNTELRDNLKLSQSVNVSNSKQNPVLELGTFFGNPFLTRYYMNPFFNPYNADGTYNITSIGSLHNTLYRNENDVKYNKLTRMSSNTKLDYTILEDLTFTSRMGLDFVLAEYKSFDNRYNGDGVSVNGRVSMSDNKNYNWVSQNSLNYKFNIDKHNFDVTALFEYQKNHRNFLSGYGENFSTDGLTNIASAGANFDASSSYSDWINVSYLGMVNYNYDSKYVADITYRREGSSRFGAGQRFGDFGSVGLAWNAHQELFMEDTAFNTLRARASWGITGNSGIGINSYQALLAYNADYAGQGAIYPSQLGNPLLSWEKGNTFDLGLDFGLWDNKLSGNFSYFNRRTFDLLQSVPLSPTTGFGGQTTNIGEVKNTGVEIELNYDIIRSDKFNWSVSANIGTVNNEITKLAKNSIGDDIDPLAGSVYKSSKVGQPISGWTMRTWAGVDEATGEPTWYVDGVSGAVTSNYNSAAVVYQGASALPTYNGGLSTHIEVLDFFVDATLYFTGGHKVYEQYAQHYFRTNNFTLGSYNGVSELLDRWQKPGDVTDVPKLVYNGSDNFHATSSRHLYDGDYMRLRDVTFGYKLPNSLLSKIGVDSATFTVKGTNLFTWVKDSGLKLDPEVQASGYTTLTTPPVKSVVFGININF